MKQAIKDMLGAYEACQILKSADPSYEDTAKGIGVALTCLWDEVSGKDAVLMFGMGTPDKTLRWAEKFVEEPETPKSNLSQLEQLGKNLYGIYCSCLEHGVPQTAVGVGISLEEVYMMVHNFPRESVLELDPDVSLGWAKNLK